MEDNLINGDGSTADFVNAYGDTAIANQTPADTIDTGAMTKGNGTATTSPPSWLSSLTGLISTGANAAGAVAPLVGTLTGSTTKPNAAVAAPARQVAATPSTSSTSKFTLYAIIGAALAGVLILVLALRK
jgi:hypothetical protein